MNIYVSQRFDVSMLFFQKQDNVEQAVRELLAPLQGCRLVRIYDKGSSVTATLDILSRFDVSGRCSDKDLQWLLEAGIFCLPSVRKSAQMLGIRTVSLNGLSQSIEALYNKKHAPAN